MSEPSFRTRPWTPAPASPGSRAAAWEAAFAACYVELCEYVLRLFLQLWDTRDAPGQDRLTRPYLFVAARNRALKYLRHRRVVAAWIERASQEQAFLADSPEDECLRRELDAAVQRAIADLPRRCREVFVLRRRDTLSYQEIAARLGVSLGTVKSQMWRATVRLKERLRP